MLIDITGALAREHIADLRAGAARHHLAEAARQARREVRPVRPSRLSQLITAVRRTPSRRPAACAC